MLRSFRSTFSLKNRVVYSSSISSVAVVGLGLMGHGIAQISAQNGFQVTAVEAQSAALETGMKRIQGSLSKVISKDVQKGKYKSEAEGKQALDETMARIRPTTSLADAKDCDLIIEAIAENMDLKLNFFSQLGGLAKPEAIFASNTSSLQITAMGEKSGRPTQFVGLHFFNPVQIMKLVEVIRTEKTDQAIFDQMLQFTQKIGKTPVSCKDTPGFIVNRLLVPYLAQAIALLDRGEGSVKDIDTSMMLGAGHPMGPLQLADYVGLDTCLSILNGWKQTHPNEPSFIIPKSLEVLVAKGEFGRKTGKGFYTWEGDKAIAPR